MTSYTVQILNPKAKKLLKNLEELRLIAIEEQSEIPLSQLVRSLRSKKSSLSIDEITKEVDSIRAKRYGKKS